MLSAVIYLTLGSLLTRLEIRNWWKNGWRKNRTMNRTTCTETTTTVARAPDALASHIFHRQRSPVLIKSALNQILHAVILISLLLPQRTVLHPFDLLTITGHAISTSLPAHFPAPGCNLSGRRIRIHPCKNNGIAQPPGAFISRQPPGNCRRDHGRVHGHPGYRRGHGGRGP